MLPPEKRPDWTDLIVLAGTILAIVIVYLFLRVAFSRGAPAPLARPKPDTTCARLTAPDLIGTWAMDWCGIDYATTLDGLGRYQAISPYGSIWQGQWSLDPDGNLWVSEAILDTDTGLLGSPMTWTVKWDRTKGRIDRARLSGELDRGGKFALRKMEKK